MNFEVTRYYITSCTFYIKAENEDEAYHQTLSMDPDTTDILNNLEEHNHIDEVEELEE